MSFIRVALCSAPLCLAAALGAAQDGGRTIARQGDWVLSRVEGPSGGDAPCILAPKARSRIRITGDRLEVTGLPRNSIFNYQYRIDDEPVSNVQFPTAQMQEAGAIWLAGDVLGKILDGRRFSIRLLDKWHEAITEDVSLSGLRALHDTSGNACR